MELLPRDNYYSDLDAWYETGRHPRFSIVGALKDAEPKLRYGEICGLQACDETKRALRTCNTPRQFRKAMQPYMSVWLYRNGTKTRVTTKFKQQFKDESFTVKAFLDESNQELRRLMLRRGVEVKDVLAKMEVISQDSEGTLLQYNSDRYLHVKCPSTGEEYLLNVPRSHWATDGKTVQLDTPAKARRWTFNVPEDTVFAKEA